MKHEFTVVVRAPKKHSRDEVLEAFKEAIGDEVPLLILGDYFQSTDYEGFGMEVKDKPTKPKVKRVVKEKA